MRSYKKKFTTNTKKATTKEAIIFGNKHKLKKLLGMLLAYKLVRK